MKLLRFLLLIPLAFLLTGSVTTNMLQVVAKKRAAGAPVSTLQDTYGTNGGGQAMARNTAEVYTAGDYIAGATYTLTQIRVIVTETGTYANNLSLQLWSDNGGGESALPNALIASSNETYSGGDIGTATQLTYTFDPTAITSGTRYHVVAYSSNYDTSNYVGLHVGAYNSGETSKAAVALTWSNLNEKCIFAEFWGY